MPTVISAFGEKPTAQPDWSQLKTAVEANEVHGVIVTNPLNPSGHVLTEEEISLLLGLADKHDLFVIFDECYVDMMFNGKKHLSPLRDGIRSNVVCCRGFSKCMGCQSWRCGYAISGPETLQGMMAMQDPLYICANWTQHALGTYFRENLSDFQEHCVKLNNLLQENWTTLSTALQKRFGWEPLQPDGTMYGMFKHSDESDIKACERALKVGVGVCPGNVFYGDATKPPSHTGWIRIHCGVTREKALAIAKILDGEK